MRFKYMIYLATISILLYVACKLSTINLEPTIKRLIDCAVNSIL
jgi:hypothetical protein